MSAYSYQAPQRVPRSLGHGLGIIIIAFGNEDVLRALITRLLAEKRDNDYIVLIDNHPAHGCAQIAESIPGVDAVIRSKNIGFAAGCNRAAKEFPSHIDLILLLNPDVVPAPLAITKLRVGAQADWSAWMGLLTLPDNTVNSAGTIVHMSGLSWCGQYGESQDSLTHNTQVNFLSGACLMIKRQVWEDMGGFCEGYFMYYEDTDLCLRMRQQGLKLGLVVSARFEHDYTFSKSPQKWFYLERNRYEFMWRLWPASVITVMMPYLFVCEVGLWVVSLLQGRLLLRLRSITNLTRQIPVILIERRLLQPRSTLTGVQFLDLLQPAIDTPLLGSFLTARVLNTSFRAYHRVVRVVLSKLSG